MNLSTFFLHSVPVAGNPYIENLKCFVRIDRARALFRAATEARVEAGAELRRALEPLHTQRDAYGETTSASNLLLPILCAIIRLMRAWRAALHQLGEVVHIDCNAPAIVTATIVCHHRC